MDLIIANRALALAMEWGEHWMQQVQDRLAPLHPELSRAQLDHYDQLARAAMKQGHQAVYDVAAKHQGDGNATQAASAPEIRKRIPWASEENVGRLVSQGMYYAWKDGALG